jgi:Uma2 family endonuclease
MVATQVVETPIQTVKKAMNLPQKKISWQEFERKYLHREDGFKYEWVDGTIEKTKRTMYQKQYRFLKNLRQLFEALSRIGQISGGLEAEIDTFFLDKVHRRPDVAYFTREQEIAMSQGSNEVPRFVIEIISDNDPINGVHKKMQNYRNAGVQVVWHIFPELDEVHVYYGEMLTYSVVCKGDAICSAAPVLPAFEIAARDIFKPLS